ncbi:MAG: hypothetical protein KJP23_06710 [Deltaproteobacteria bacterium]|nr:hypothetical protein [Deltaproteobacteria bacterium]
MEATGAHYESPGFTPALAPVPNKKRKFPARAGSFSANARAGRFGLKPGSISQGIRLPVENIIMHLKELVAQCFPVNRFHPLSFNPIV